MARTSLSRDVLLVLEELEVTLARRTKHAVSALELSRDDDVPARLGIQCALDHVSMFVCVHAMSGGVRQAALLEHSEHCVGRHEGALDPKGAQREVGPTNLEAASLEGGPARSVGYDAKPHDAVGKPGIVLHEVTREDVVIQPNSMRQVVVELIAQVTLEG